MPIYPHTARAVAEELAKAAKTPEMKEVDLIGLIEYEIVKYACNAAEIVNTGPEAPLSIKRLIWHKDDGWDHGGMAETWKEYAEELKKELYYTRKMEEDAAESMFAAIRLIAEIRAAAGDPEGKLMQSDLIELIRKQAKTAK